MKLEARVSASLDAIREQLAHTRMSTSTMNFVVVIDDANRREWILERAAMLAEKHPSFSLVFDRTGQCGGATVITSDRDVVSHFTVQGEQVVIGASDFSPEDLVEYLTTLC